MLPRRLEEREGGLHPTELNRLVALRAEPGCGCRSGTKLGAGTKGESPAEGKLVGVQSKRHQQRANGRIPPRLNRLHQG